MRVAVPRRARILFEPRDLYFILLVANEIFLFSIKFDRMLYGMVVYHCQSNKIHGQDRDPLYNR